MPNKLVNESSPYLLQHSTNPVEWYPFGDEAFQVATARNVPLLISIGYSACHWCHVMEHESFSQQQIADLMNKHFVCIKVDREERPDVDQIYINAVQLIHGQGGWPLNCFALPDGRPFWGGTYFTPKQWVEVILHMSDLYQNNHDEIISQAEQIHKGISTMGFIEAPKADSELTVTSADEVYKQLELRFDKSKGGMKGSPKFPMPSIWQFVLAYYYATKSKNALGQLKLTLDKMAAGGIFDQLGGGFARYSTDIDWKVPHFEKMLYDNAQLSILYTEAFKITGDTLYYETLNKILSFIKTDLTSPEGAFYASLDADSEGVEGKFYVWKKNEILDLFPEYGELLSRYWGIDNQGLWENDKNILVKPFNDEYFAMNEHLSTEELKQLVTMATKVMLKHRNQRIRPGLDDKIIVSWNAMMIKGYAYAAGVQNSEEWKNIALNAANFINVNLISPEGYIKRSWKDNKVKINGFLDDYAHCAEAFIQLYQLTFDEYWLFRAKRLTEIVVDLFSQHDSPMFWYIPESSDENSIGKISRILETTDGVEPSGNSIVAYVLLILGNYFEDEDYITRSASMCKFIKNNMITYPSYYAKWAYVVTTHAIGLSLIAITGPKAYNFAANIQSKYNPMAIIAAATESSKIPALRNKINNTGKTLIYKCKNHVCESPIEHIDDLKI